MNLDYKRIIILIAFIAAVFLIGFLLFFFFLKPALPTTVTNNAALPGGALPGTNGAANIPMAINGGLLPSGLDNRPAEITTPEPLGPADQQTSGVATGGLTKTTVLADTRTLSPVIGSDGQSAYYYDQNTGLFYKITADGRTTQLSEQVFYEVKNIDWSPDKTQAILEYPDGSNIMYDFTSKKQITLPKHWEDFSFSPTGSQIVFKSMGTSADNRWVAVSNTDGSKAKKIEHLGNMDASVYTNWSPAATIVAMWTEDSSFDRQDLMFLGMNEENFKSTKIEGRGFEGQWSAKGDRLLYSVYSSDSGYRPTLWIVDAAGDNIGGNRKNIKLQTWADKCTFADNDNLYCAVPTSLDEGAGIYKNEMNNQPTEIYHIDLNTGFKTRVAIPEGNYNAEELIVTGDNRYLYFTDKNTNKLYKIDLK